MVTTSILVQVQQLMETAWKMPNRSSSVCIQAPSHVYREVVEALAVPGLSKYEPEACRVGPEFRVPFSREAAASPRSFALSTAGRSAAPQASESGGREPVKRLLNGLQTSAGCTCVSSETCDVTDPHQDTPCVTPPGHHTPASDSVDHERLQFIDITFDHRRRANSALLQTTELQRKDPESCRGTVLR
ncbi:hypothetical protein GN956_G11632 [Arapaima gigas]